MTHGPPDDDIRVEIGHRAEIQPAFDGLDERVVGHPLCAGVLGTEVAREMVRNPGWAWIGTLLAPALLLRDTTQSLVYA